MEYFDVLNKNGELTGEIAEKGCELLSHQFDLGVHLYIYNSKGEFLLQRRTFDKEFRPGGWDIHMGHVISGETSEAAMIRELSEELGIKVSELTLLKRFKWDKYNHFIDIYTLCMDIPLEDLVLQKSEVLSAKYVSTESMLELIDSMDYRPAEYVDCIRSYVQSI